MQSCKAVLGCHGHLDAFTLTYIQHWSSVVCEQALSFQKILNEAAI